MFSKKVLLIFFLFASYKIQAQNNLSSLVILGIAQDGGSPQIGCDKSCCKSLVILKEEYQDFTST